MLSDHSLISDPINLYLLYFPLFQQEGATVDDVLTRYKVLASAKEDLEAQLQQYGAAYRDLQVEIQRHHKEAYSRTLQHNNEIANLSRKLEAAVAESAQLEESVRIVEVNDECLDVPFYFSTSFCLLFIQHMCEV